MRLRIATLLAAGVFAVSAGAVPAAATAAEPKGGCTAGVVCSETTNEMSRLVYAAKHWCDSGSHHGPCAPLSRERTRMYLHKGQTTPSFEDWDAFHVPAHCTFTVKRHWYSDTTAIKGGAVGKWVQVHDDEHYYIEKAAC